MTEVQIAVLTSQHGDNLLKSYEEVYSSKEEVQAFYGRFLENGWALGSWKNGELVGMLTWAPREAVTHGLAEIIDFWVKPEERRKGIGAKLLDTALTRMEQYYTRFGAALRKVMLFTGATERYRAARTLYEKRGFRVVVKIPRNALDNPDGEELLYVLRVRT